MNLKTDFSSQKQRIGEELFTSLKVCEGFSMASKGDKEPVEAFKGGHYQEGQGGLGLTGLLVCVEF